MIARLTIFDQQAIAAALPTVRLPALPKALSYWDDFAECTRIISSYDSCSLIEVHDDGIITRWGLELYTEFQRGCVKAVIADLIGIGDVTSVKHWMSNMKSVCSHLGHSLIEQLSIIQPFEITRTLGFLHLSIVDGQAGSGRIEAATALFLPASDQHVGAGLCRYSLRAFGSSGRSFPSCTVGRMLCAG